jgi:hypothetical protein
MVVISLSFVDDGEEGRSFLSVAQFGPSVAGEGSIEKSSQSSNKIFVHSNFTIPPPQWHQKQAKPSVKVCTLFEYQELG